MLAACKEANGEQRKNEDFAPRREESTDGAG